MDSYSAEISKALFLLSKYRANAKEVVGDCVYIYDFNDEERIIGLLQTMVESYRNQIHSYLVPLENRKAEQEIRSHIKDISREILPIVDNKIRKITADILRLEKKLAKDHKKGAEILKEKERLSDYQLKYIMLLDDFKALVAFRSFKMFCLYMETDIAPKDKIWEYSKEIALPIWNCLEKMALDGTIKMLFKQTPTGYFKTWSDSNFIAWIYGVDINADCMKVVGQPDMIAPCMNGITGLMTNQRYAKVFPYYAKYNCRKEDMFNMCVVKEGKLLINGSFRGLSLLIFSKDATRDGLRFKWRFYDDITRQIDKSNINAHDIDCKNYHNTWKLRRYTEKEDFEIFSGTGYSVYDFISRIKEENGVASAIKHPNYKYTHFSKDGKAIFIAIPKLDYATGECTLPDKYTREEAEKDKARDYETFMAMQQQRPIPPDGMAFDWKKIKVYSALPLKESEGGNRSENGRAALDPARTGANYLSLGIHSKCGNIDYLVDCFYKKCPLDFKMPDGRTALEHCCDLIIKHKVMNWLIEINTVSNLKQQITDILHKRGYFGCVIDTIYTTKKKNDKIFEQQSTIIDCICFPQRSMYAESSMMGQYMRDVVTWNTKSDYDDSIDTEAMYTKHFWSNKQKKAGTIEILSRKR